MRDVAQEPEIAAPVLLCDSAGRLNGDAVGWSRTPLHTCNLPDALPRKKRWNYWCVTSDTLLFSATIADLDVAQMAFAYIYERDTRRFAEETVVLPGGTVPMPQTTRGDIIIDHPQMRVAITDAGASTRLRVDAPDFRGEALSVDIAIEMPPGHETLNVVIPWSVEQFQFTSKQNCLPATGAVTFGERAHTFAAPSFAVLDYGRGVWPEHTLWNWGAGSGVQAGRTVGLNLGGRWTDGTGMTENGICVDGRLTKIGEDLRFDYDAGDRMRTWTIRTVGSDRIDLRFTPEYERLSKGGNETYFSEVHQMFGVYDGRVVAEHGAPVEIAGLFGWIEDHEARW